MEKLNHASLPPEIASLLLQRGTATPPVCWSEHASQPAKQALDLAEDATLFGNEAVKDEAMAGAVRALLYLWNGWIAECRMYAMGAPEAECTYLCGLAERQLGNRDAAKSTFQRLEEHVVYENASAFAGEQIRPASGARLVRFKQILDLNGGWEPHAFTDLFEAARGGNLTGPEEDLFRVLQLGEFNLLLTHCLSKTLGREIEAVSQAVAPTTDQKKKRTERTSRDLAEKRRAANRPKPKAKEEEDATPLQNVRVKCPKCKHPQLLLTAVPKQVIGCEKCRSKFMVPSRKKAA